MKDLKYLFAYTVPLAAFVSVGGNGLTVFTAPIYVFVFIPLLEMVLADYDKQYTEEEKTIASSTGFLMFYCTSISLLSLGYCSIVFYNCIPIPTPTPNILGLSFPSEFCWQLML